VTAASKLLQTLRLSYGSSPSPLSATVGNFKCFSNFLSEMGHLSSVSVTVCLTVPSCCKQCHWTAVCPPTGSDGHSATLLYTPRLVFCSLVCVCSAQRVDFRLSVCLTTLAPRTRVWLKTSIMEGDTGVGKGHLGPLGNSVGLWAPGITCPT
jgi:hypothetical protein